MSEPRLRVAALSAFLTGTVVLLLAEATWLRVGSAVVLISFVVLALFAIATPRFLEGEEDE